MKFFLVNALAVLTASSAFNVNPTFPTSARGSALSMVLEKPKVKTIAKIEQLKVDSDHLVHPLKEVSKGFSYLGVQLTSK